jgi:hypothetical protein
MEEQGVAMTDNRKLCPDKAPSARNSFILRCWRNSLGELRARVVDVGTGVSYPLLNLAELPGLIEQLVQPHAAAPDSPNSTRAD